MSRPTFKWRILKAEILEPEESPESWVAFARKALKHVECGSEHLGPIQARTFLRTVKAGGARVSCFVGVVRVKVPR